MKRTTVQLAVWGTVTALGLSAFTSSISAAQDDSTAPSKTRAGRTESLQSSGKTLGHVERANKLIGKEVIGSDNQKLGKIDNLVVDLESGHILYAVIGSGGVGAIGEKKFAVAPGVFTEMSAQNETRESRGVFQRGSDLHANIDKTKLNGAPQFTKDIDKDTELSKAEFVDQVYQYWGQNAWWKGAAGSKEGQFNNVHKASEIIV